MDASEIVVHEVQRDRVHVIVHLLAERIGQSREAAHRHAHGQVLALDVAGSNVRKVRIAIDPPLVRAYKR